MGNFSIQHSPWVKLSPGVQDQLRGLTLALESRIGNSSGMNQMIRSWGSYFDTWVAYEGLVAVGWSLRTHTTEGRGRGYDWGEPATGEIMTYVHPDYRRMGIGTDLIESIDKTHGHSIMFQWNEIATAFYDKVVPTWENAYA